MDPDFLADPDTAVTVSVFKFPSDRHLSMGTFWHQAKIPILLFAIQHFCKDSAVKIVGRKAPNFQPQGVKN